MPGTVCSASTKKCLWTSRSHPSVKVDSGGYLNGRSSCIASPWMRVRMAVRGGHVTFPTADEALPGWGIVIFYEPTNGTPLSMLDSKDPKNFRWSVVACLYREVQGKANRNESKPRLFRAILFARQAKASIEILPLSCVALRREDFGGKLRIQRRGE